MPFPSFFSTKYVALTTEHHDESSTEKLLPSEHPTSRTGPRKITLTLNWSTMFCCILVWALSVAVLERFVSALRHPPYLRGIDMSDGEFEPARAYVQREVVKFTGTAVFEEGGVAYRERVPGTKEYIGAGDEVDKNWDELIKGRYFYLTEEEAKVQWPTNYKQYYHDDMGWIVGLDVFHTLHCVKVINNALFNPNGSSHHGSHLAQEGSFENYHTEHCLDIIRQAIQCHADLTPIPSRRFPGHPDGFIDSDQPHTCRSISKLRDFVNLRRAKDDDGVTRIEKETGKEWVDYESAQGVMGFPERAGHEDDYRPASLRHQKQES